MSEKPENMVKKHIYLYNRKDWLETEIRRVKNSINTEYGNKEHFDSDISLCVRNYRTSLKQLLKIVLDDINELKEDGE